MDSSGTTHGQTLAARWGGVCAVGISLAGLITAELLPMSLLPLMASDLGVSEGVAGLSITATALVAFLSSLFITTMIGRINRRYVVMGYSAILIVSSLIVAFAPNFATLIVGRILLGIPSGGLWSMAAALTSRLVPAPNVPRALSLIFGAASVAFVVSAPLGTYLGEIIGWRGVFIAAAALGGVCFIWQAFSLPSMPGSGERPKITAALALLRWKGVAVAMLAVAATYFAHISLFTYLRSYLEGVVHLPVEGVSVVQFAMSFANFLCVSLLSAWVVKRSLKAALWATPFVISCCVFLAVIAASNQIPAAIALTGWNFAFGIVNVAWSTWIARNFVKNAEAAGGLQVAVIQLSGGLGAATGGVIFDLFGALGPPIVSGALFLSCALVTLLAVRPTLPQAEVAGAPQSTG